MRGFLSTIVSALACAAAVNARGAPGSAQEAMEKAMQRQKEHMARLRDFLGPMASSSNELAKKETPPSTVNFSNPAAQKFYVDGSTLPLVPFDAGPSWAGLLPISGAANETRELFFWFWPTNNASNADELLFWTNGGPGCSSLEGFLQENGPISWSWGQSQPTPNQWSWTNLSHVLWVEQPVGTGFSQGEPDISNDDELAAQLVGFLEQFLEVFSELKGLDFYLAGESYAGYYVPYIANYIYENPGLDLNLKGISIADPSLSYGLVQEEIPAFRFVQNNKNVFPFDSATMANLQNMSDSCGYTDYLDKYVTYPPAGQLPFVGTISEHSAITRPGCDIYDRITLAVQNLNPVFDVYRVIDAWPSPWSVLGFPVQTQEFIYFNRTDVQDAIHAPHVEWSLCTNTDVYVNAKTGEPGEDTSVASTLSVLPNVIEKSERTVIVHGLEDFILLAEGTRIAIQNMTWGGKQGFQTPIVDETFKLKDFGVFGNTHTERNLTYVEFYYSGHMTPQFVPWAAYSTISYLLGRQSTVNTA